MKILWICNICLPAIAKHLGIEASNKEGWISGLCKGILTKSDESEIELAIAFPVQKELDGCSGTVTEYNKELKYYGFFEDVINPHNTDPTLVGRIKSIIDDFKPDIVHCFGTEFDHTYAALCAAGDDTRVLVGIQGICSVIAKAYMADLPSEVAEGKSLRDILKRDSLLEQQDKFSKRGDRERKALALAKYVVGRTNFDKSFVKKINPEIKYFEQNETLRDAFYEGEWIQQNCELYRIFISQGDYPLKGLHYLLIAAGKLKEKYPKIRVCVAGNSLVNYKSLKDKIKISGYGKYLRKLIEKYQLEENVEFLGRLTAEQMREQYLKCNLFVCCSANENSPNSLGEAMLLGVPCVASDVGGIPTVFQGEVDGIMYETGRCWDNEKDNFTLESVSENLKQAIDRMWTEKDIRNRYLINARKHAKTTHDSEVNLLKMTEIYQNIIEDK